MTSSLTMVWPWPCDPGWLGTVFWKNFLWMNLNIPTILSWKLFYINICLEIYITFFQFQVIFKYTCNRRISSEVKMTLDMERCSCWTNNLMFGELCISLFTTYAKSGTSQEKSCCFHLVKVKNIVENLKMAIKTCSIKYISNLQDTTLAFRVTHC